MPKGSIRRSVEKDGRVQTATIHRGMSSKTVQKAILDQFKWIQSYTLLVAGKDGSTLEKADNQRSNGNDMVDKRGQVYLREEKSDPFIVSLPH